MFLGLVINNTYTPFHSLPLGLLELDRYIVLLCFDFVLCLGLFSIFFLLLLLLHHALFRLPFRSQGSTPFPILPACYVTQYQRRVLTPPN